jgi:hypothetical protein
VQQDATIQYYAVVTWNYLRICLNREENQEIPCLYDRSQGLPDAYRFVANSAATSKYRGALGFT